MRGLSGVETAAATDGAVVLSFCVLDRIAATLCVVLRRMDDICLLWVSIRLVGSRRQLLQAGLDYARYACRICVFCISTGHSSKMKKDIPNCYIHRNGQFRCVGDLLMHVHGSCLWCWLTWHCQSWPARSSLLTWREGGFISFPRQPLPTVTC